MLLIVLLRARNPFARELRFGLLKQRLLELVRRGATDEALSFAVECLAPESAGDPAMLRQVEEAVTLLAFEVPMFDFLVQVGVHYRSLARFPLCRIVRGAS